MPPAWPRREMRARKAAIFAVLAADMRALEQREGEHYPLFDEWIAAGLNNARLAAVATYYDCVPGFRQLLRSRVGICRASTRRCANWRSCRARRATHGCAATAAEPQED